jgi:hypothetical protein
MARWLLALAPVVAAASAAAGSATTVPAEQFLIPYLSGGAGVYLDGDGRPVSSEGAPHTPGIHVRPAVALPVPQPQPVPQPAPQPPTQQPSPIPVPIPTVPTPAPVPAPSPDGYQRLDLAAAVGLPNVTSVFCRTDGAWPSQPPYMAGATGYWVWGGSAITMRTWRCEGIAQERIGTEAFARGLFVLAHEAAHATGIADECEADKRGLATMGAITARLGWGYTVGDDAGRYLNNLLRANPPPDPYCLGRLP